MLDVKFIPHPKIDQLMENEIAKSNLWPDAEGELFDIETFLTQHLKADLDQDAFLEEGVMGEVEFRRGKKPASKSTMTSPFKKKTRARFGRSVAGA